MDIFDSFILALTRGLTEIFPVSSSGHLTLICRILGMEKPSVGYQLICNLGILLAILLALGKDFLALAKNHNNFCICSNNSNGIAPSADNIYCKKQKQFQPIWLVILTIIPTIIIAAIIKYFFSNFFGEEYLVYGFLLTAILLLVAGFTPLKPSKKPTIFDALIIGFTQGLSCLPGISRSGATIATGVALGFNRQASARFGFVIYAPIIVIYSVILLATQGLGANIGVFPLLIGFFTTFASAFLAIKILTKILSKFNLDFFAVYLFALSVLILLNDYLIHLL